MAPSTALPMLLLNSASAITCRNAQAGNEAAADLLGKAVELDPSFAAAQYALGVVQLGGIPPSTKPWKGEGPGVFEIVEDHRGDTYRVAYTVRFAKAVYVLHCFQKKSPSGIHAPGKDVKLIRERLKLARADYEVRYGK